MGTSKDTMLFLADQLQACDLGEITYRKMFGEYGVYLNGQIFSLVCDDRLFFKVKHLDDAVVDRLFGNRQQPFPGANGYAEVPVDFLEDIPELTLRLGIVMKTLPASKPKKPRAKKP
jgi:TfoX N-terminal domain